MLLPQKNGNCAIFGDFQTDAQRIALRALASEKRIWRLSFSIFYKSRLLPPNSAGFGSPVISGSNSESSNTGVIVALAE